MHLLRYLFFVTAFYELSLRPVRVLGSFNIVADAISRNNMVLFRLQVPGARPMPMNLPPILLDLFIHQCPDWTSLAWCQSFSSSDGEGVQDRLKSIMLLIILSGNSF